MIRKKTGLVEGYIATLEICAKTSWNTILNISKNYVLIQSLFSSCFKNAKGF